MLTVLRHGQRHWTSELRVATGRSAVGYLITKVHPKAVLMPCYVPEGIIGPFQRAQVPIKFYKLREDLRPDLDHLNRQLCKDCLVIIIHYFGYITETGALREMISGAGGTLFEDCAHTLFAKAPDADVALWSLNKFLPVVDGAILRSRRHDINVGLTGIVRTQLPDRTMTAYHEHLALNSRLVKVDDPKQAADLMNESMIAYERYYHEINSDLGLYSQSHESRIITENTDFEEIKKVRDHNSALYYKKVPKCFHLRSFAPSAPFAFPIVIRSPYNCERVYERLIGQGVMAAKLIDKWDHIPKGDGRFFIEHAFMDEHLLLPVDESVTYDDVIRISKCLEEIASEN